MKHPTRFIETISGRMFWPLTPDADDVRAADIAHALSLKCRFGGHIRDHYSVAQHSVLVSMHVPPYDRLAGLLHDAAEAYLPDIQTPIKPSIVGFAEIEERLMAVICSRYAVPFPLSPYVHDADKRALLTEKRDIVKSPRPWPIDALDLKPFDQRIEPWPAAYAEARFLDRFAELGGGAE